MLHYQSAFFAKKKRDNQHITSERGATGLVAISSQTAKWLNMFTVFFAVAVVAAVGILEIPLLNLLVVSVVFLTMALLHFADSWKKRIIHLVLFCAIMIISEALLFILFRLTMANPAQNPLTIAISLAAIRLFLIVLLSRRFGDRSFLQTGPSSLLHHHLILGMVILGYASLMTNIYLLEETNLMPVLLNIVFILILFLLFYFFVDIVQNIDRKKMENQALRLRQNAYSEYYDSLSENEKKIRGFRHDMKNQLIGISALPEEKVKAEIASMIDELDTPSKAIYTQKPDRATRTRDETFEPRDRAGKLHDRPRHSGRTPHEPRAFSRSSGEQSRQLHRGIGAPTARTKEARHHHRKRARGCDLPISKYAQRAEQPGFRDDQARKKPTRLRSKKHQSHRGHLRRPPRHRLSRRVPGVDQPTALSYGIRTPPIFGGAER